MLTSGPSLDDTRIGMFAVSISLCMQRIICHKIRIFSIAVQHDGIVDRPLDPECGIIPTYATTMLWGVERSHLVENFSVVFESHKTMSEVFGHIQHLVILAAERHRNILLERRRVWTKINDDVVNGSVCTAHQLRLGCRCNLIVHAAKCAFAFVKRYIALNDAGVQMVIGKFFFAPRACEEATVITSFLWLNEAGAF